MFHNHLLAKQHDMAQDVLFSLERVTSFFSFPLLFLVLLFLNTCTKQQWRIYPFLLFFFFGFVFVVYLKLPPNVGVQKSVEVSAATGKVLDIGTRQRPRLFRSCVNLSSSLILSTACNLIRKYIWAKEFRYVLIIIDRWVPL